MAAAAKAVNKAEQKIAITIPRMGVNEDPYVLVGVNFVNTQIPRGKPVMVSRKVYDVLRRSDSAKIVSEAFLVGNVYEEPQKK